MNTLSLKGRVCKNASLKEYSYIRLGGRAKWLVFPNNFDDLATILMYIYEHHLSYFILGNGSNVLFSQDLFDGVVIALHEYESSINFEQDMVICKGHVMLDRLINESYRNSLSGFECLVGIPGTVGASVFNNTGTPAGAICDHLQRLTYINSHGEVCVLTGDEIHHSYRNGPLLVGQGVIVETQFQLKSGDASHIKARMKKAAMHRKHTQPLDALSLGCVFKNPTAEISASQLIDRSGLKGLAKGDIEVSVKHANFLINRGAGDACDFLNLVEAIQASVFQKTGQLLELEIQIN